MTEHDKWERWWRESADRDLAREIYKRCDEEDRIADERRTQERRAGGGAS